MLRSTKFPAYVLSLCLLWVGSAHSQGPSQPASGMTTHDRIQAAGWWPTRRDASRKEFVGSARCADCHSDIYARQAQTSMAKAGNPGSSTAGLQSRPTLSARQGQYMYEISNTGSGSQYRVWSGQDQLAGPLNWIFGAGDIGQTYILERGGNFLESHVSYYPALHGLDLTPGQMAGPPKNLKQAVGHPMEEEDTRLCFGCHTTGSMITDRFDPNQATPGVTCEACHGPGAKHVAAAQANQVDHAVKAILNPGRLKPADQVDYCGACHRSSADVASFPAGTLGLLGVRFQPYRLQKSKCWRKGGGITCLSCHDPHQQIVRDATAYDKYCLTCHQASQAEAKSAVAKAPACPVNSVNCVSCHMKKYDIWAAHATFTDHYIRIVRAGEKYPE